MMKFEEIKNDKALLNAIDWEMTPESERALSRGLDWLAENQGPEGNWKSNDLGLVGIGALAFLADGHMPKRGRHGRAADRALNYVLDSLKVQGEQRAMFRLKATPYGGKRESTG